MYGKFCSVCMSFSQKVAKRELCRLLQRNFKSNQRNIEAENLHILFTARLEFDYTKSLPSGCANEHGLGNLLGSATLDTVDYAQTTNDGSPMSMSDCRILCWHM